MLEARQSLKGRISAKSSLKGKLNNAIEYVYPELEDLEVTPSGEEQHFKSDKYGYNEVTVHAVESDELAIMPTTEEQVHEGLYKKVTVPGAPDMLPENIADGKEIFGVIGSAKTANFKITSGRYLFYNGDRVDYLNEILALCEGIKNVYSMFEQATTLRELDLSNLDVSNVTNMSRMFANTAITILNMKNWNTGKVTNMSYMFYGCSSLTELDLSNFNTSEVTNMNSMFGSCKSLTKLNLSNWNTENITSMSNMFDYCDNLSQLDVNNWDTSKVTTMNRTFYYCRKLTKLNLSSWNTKNVTNMTEMFNSCSSLTELDLSNFDTSEVTNISYMFVTCNSLTKLDLSKFDLSKVTNVNGMIKGLNKLTSFKSFKNLGKGYTQKTNNYSNYTLDISASTQLPHDDLVDLITNGLYDLNLSYNVANGGVLYTQSCVIGPTNIAKLEATEEGRAALAQAALYGWTIS